MKQQVIFEVMADSLAVRNMIDGEKEEALEEEKIFFVGDITCSLMGLYRLHCLLTIFEQTHTYSPLLALILLPTRHSLA